MNKSEELTALLKQSLEDFRASDDFRKYLRAMARFHRYSFNNVILICRQMPSATIVAGYTTWKRQHRQVRRGEHGLRIFAPVPVTRDEEMDDGTTAPVTRTFFKAATVFDISQTDGEDLPVLHPSSESFAGTVRDFDTLWDRASHLVSDVTVTVKAVTGEARGWFTPSSHQIVVRDDLSESERLKTLMHEMAHAALHADSRTPPEQAECEAEGTAFVVCQALGFDTTDYSVPYVAGYVKDAPAEDIAPCFERIQRTADRFITALKGEEK